eukprot:g44918.t1
MNHEGQLRTPGAGPGEELEYEYDERGSGTWVCRVRLPVEDALGRELAAEVTHTGKKKEAMVQCSLEACKILDARGVLRLEAEHNRTLIRWAEEWQTEVNLDKCEELHFGRDLSYRERLNWLGLLSLENRRLRGDLKELCEIMRGIDS